MREIVLAIKDYLMSEILPATENIGPPLSEYVEQDERTRRLCPPVMRRLRDAGHFKLFLPKSLGGQEASPLAVARLVENIARHNPAAAWSIMVANAGNWWSKYLPAKGVEEIFLNDHDVFTAGAFNAPMMASRVKNGYSVTGQIPLCSNVHEAKWVGALSMVAVDGTPVFVNGMPEMRAVFMRVSECKIVDTWQALGMRATDSNDIAADKVFVPDHRSFLMSPEAPLSEYHAGPLYRYPVVGINGCSLVIPVALGIAASAVEEMTALGEKTALGSPVKLKEKGSFQRQLGMAEALVRSSRAYLHQTMGDVWARVQSGEAATLDDKAALLLAATSTIRSCVQAVDLVYGAAGTSGVYDRSRISRHFRDIQVVRHHGFGCEARFETAAQLMFGSMPDFLPAAL